MQLASAPRKPYNHECKNTRHRDDAAAADTAKR